MTTTYNNHNTHNNHYSDSYNHYSDNYNYNCRPHLPKVLRCHRCRQIFNISNCKSSSRYSPVHSLSTTCKSRAGTAETGTLLPRHAFVPEKPYIWSFVPVRYQLDFFHAFSRSILAKKHTLHDGFCQQELKVTIDTEAWCAKPVSQSIKHSSQRLLFIQQLPSYIPSGNFRPNLYANSHS